MELSKKITMVTLGTMIGFASVSAYPFQPVRAEEITISESSTQLKTLLIEQFQLNKTFAPDIKTYTANVANDIESMDLQLETMVESALVTINGEQVTSGEKKNLSLQTGENTFTITVKNGAEINTYTITVIREKNNNNKLSNMTVTNGDFAFDPEKTSYEVHVKNEIKSMTIKPELAVNTSEIEINGKKVKDKENYVATIPVGTTTFDITVTAENGEIKTYTLTVIKDEETVEEQVKEPSKTDNSDDQEKEKTSSQKPISNDSSKGTSMQNPGAEAQSKNPSTLQRPAMDTNQSGQSNVTASTKIGENSKEEGTKANLNTLTISNGSWNKSFLKEEYTYHISVENDLSNVTIVANPEESDAALTIDGQKVSSSAKVKVDDQAQTVISVVVTHENDRKTYVLVFDKDMDETETTVEAATNVVDEVHSTAVPSVEKETQKQMSKGTIVEDNLKSMSLWQRILSLLGF